MVDDDVEVIVLEVVAFAVVVVDVDDEETIDVLVVEIDIV